jgi:thiamine biosynthesis lipoprotein
MSFSLAVGKSKMKKIYLLFLIIFSAFLFGACKAKTEDVKYGFHYMSTFIAIDIKSVNTNSKERIGDELENIFKMYHELATNMDSLPDDTKYLENIFSINKKPLENIEINKELYELLVDSLDYYNLTEGFFDASIGKIIDVWKDSILSEESGLLFEEIPDEVFEDIFSTVENIEIYKNPFTLNIINNKYYVKLNYNDVKLNLGAIAKGYATQKAADYIESLGFENYSITSGSSSIILGKNPNRENDIFIVSLANPIREINNKLTYGKIHVKETSVTTSGNYEQYANYKGLRYHHIISPETKAPVHYYHTVTIIGDNAGLLDALSTALFNMSPSKFDEWMEKHQEELGIEVIRFNYDGTITKYLKNIELRD